MSDEFLKVKQPETDDPNRTVLSQIRLTGAVHVGPRPIAGLVTASDGTFLWYDSSLQMVVVRFPGNPEIFIPLHMVNGMLSMEKYAEFVMETERKKEAAALEAQGFRNRVLTAAAKETVVRVSKTSTKPRKQ